MFVCLPVTGVLLDLVLFRFQDASIPVHIENICSRNYVRVDGSRQLVPTKLGIVLVHGYQKVQREGSAPSDGVCLWTREGRGGVMRDTTNMVVGYLHFTFWLD